MGAWNPEHYCERVGLSAIALSQRLAFQSDIAKQTWLGILSWC